MEPFYATNTCPKCSSGSASYKFHPDACPEIGADREHMHRQCPLCGFAWAELARQTLRREPAADH
jgi:ribosomal protein S27AE